MHTKSCLFCGKIFEKKTTVSLHEWETRKKFCSRTCVDSWRKTSWVSPKRGVKYPQYSGKLHPRWRGGKKKLGNGYVMLLKPDHPFSNKQGYIFEHRVVAEQILGRFLYVGEVVHHVNGNKSDNRPENLEVMTRREHLKHHFPNPWNKKL